MIFCIYVTSLDHDESFYKAYTLYHAGSGYIHNFITVNIYTAFGLLAVWAISGCLGQKINERACHYPWLVTLGDWTYSLYIIHWPVLQVLKPITSNLFLQVVCGLVVTLLLTYIWERKILPKIYT